MMWRFGKDVTIKIALCSFMRTHTRLISPSMPIPLKSVLGSSPWNPMSPHCLVILDSSLMAGINSSHNCGDKLFWTTHLRCSSTPEATGMANYSLFQTCVMFLCWDTGKRTFSNKASCSWLSELNTSFLRSSTDKNKVLYPVICSKQTWRVPLNLDI